MVTYLEIIIIGSVSLLSDHSYTNVTDDYVFRTGGSEGPRTTLLHHTIFKG